MNAATEWSVDWASELCKKTLEKYRLLRSLAMEWNSGLIEWSQQAFILLKRALRVQIPYCATRVFILRSHNSNHKHIDAKVT